MKQVQRVRRVRHGHGLLMAMLLLASPLAAQRPIDVRDRNTFRAGSELVTTAVTVRDAEGRLITNLEQKDFVVEEDGVPQPITQFTKERVPVSLALTLDISDSMRGQRMADARSALAHFLDALLAAEDEASLLGFNHETRLFTAWTTLRAGMRQTLDGIRPSGGTAMYDAIDAVLPLFGSRQHPRAAILLVSDGADTASDATPTQLKQLLVRSDVFLYAIGINSIDAKNSTRINPYTLQELTNQSGGYTEIVSSAAELGPATERIAEELNNQYVIGYTPTARGDGRYHTIRVKVTNDAYRVRARRGVVR
ncbi:MAG TPA: VWA domain-containing protein [Vicinamibacterales bacterium]|nr:VWA domain-containing protein [Vicinamibacterales bacterium]